jgi:hypothetical protein
MTPARPAARPVPRPPCGPLDHTGDSANIAFYAERGRPDRYVLAEVLRDDYEAAGDGSVTRREMPVFRIIIRRHRVGELSRFTHDPASAPASGPLPAPTVTQLVWARLEILAARKLSRHQLEALAAMDRLAQRETTHPTAREVAHETGQSPDGAAATLSSLVRRRMVATVSHDGNRYRYQLTSRGIAAAHPDGKPS